MWLSDLAKAIQEVNALRPDCVITKVAPAGAGIVFYTTHFSRIFWCDGGQVIERYDNGEEKILKNFS
jgi:hypothetical protein